MGNIWSAEEKTSSLHDFKVFKDGPSLSSMAAKTSSKSGFDDFFKLIKLDEIQMKESTKDEVFKNADGFRNIYYRNDTHDKIMNSAVTLIFIT